MRANREDYFTFRDSEQAKRTDYTNFLYTLLLIPNFFKVVARYHFFMNVIDEVLTTMR